MVLHNNSQLKLFVVILPFSVAILKYLATKYNVPEHWYPRTNIQNQARVDEYMNWQHWNTRSKAALLFRKMVITNINRQDIHLYRYTLWSPHVKTYICIDTLCGLLMYAFG